MARKYRIAATGAVSAVALLAALLAGAYYAARQVQPFYTKALEIEPEVLERGSRELESRATALYSDARQQGQWQATFTAEQINGWLAKQVAENQGRDMPKNFRDPRIAITKESLTLGFRTTSGGVDTVITVHAGVFLTEDGSVAVRLMSVRAGALPLPIMRLADELAAACQRLSLPVRWTHQGTEPVALIEVQADPASDKPQLFIDAIELGESQLSVAGHTERSSKHDVGSLRLPSAVRQPHQEVALGDYELRLTPLHKDGPLRIARRPRKKDANDKTNEDSQPKIKLKGAVR
jgi:hypothetical protein